MKKILFTMIVLFATVTANAQLQGFISTGQNVNVRTGPGLKYKVAIDEVSGEECQLSKGQVAKYLGKKQNGYTYVEVSSTITEYYCKGWVASKYLKPVTLCPACKGEGYTNIIAFGEGTECKRCKTLGYFPSNSKAK